MVDHLSSVIHVLQRNRTEHKILAGPKDNPKLHSLNGRVSTPLFDHLGASSWHSYDSRFLVFLGECGIWILPVLIIGLVCAMLLITDWSTNLGRSHHRVRGSQLDKRIA